MISEYGISPAYPHPQHTALPIPFPVQGKRLMVVADEDVAKLRPSAPAIAWVFDITDEERPIPISTFQVDGVDPDGAPQVPMTGCHQPSEVVTGTEIPFAWFAQGLRVVDIADPRKPVEVAHFLPDPPEGADRVCANDATVDGARPDLPDRPDSRSPHSRTRLMWQGDGKPPPATWTL